MNWRNKAHEAVVGGLSGLAVVTIYIIVRAGLNGASDGEWLAFAGAVLGTGLAVSGAQWIEREKRRVERVAEAKAIRVSVIKLRSISNMLLTERPGHFSEADWQEAVNHAPQSLTAYIVGLGRTLSRLTTATDDFDIVEAGDMTHRAAKKAEALLMSGNGDDAPRAVAALGLLRNSCDIALLVIDSRLENRKALSFAEAIESVEHNEG